MTSYDPRDITGPYLYVCVTCDQDRSEYNVKAVTRDYGELFYRSAPTPFLVENGIKDRRRIGAILSECAKTGQKLYVEFEHIRTHMGDFNIDYRVVVPVRVDYYGCKLDLNCRYVLFPTQILSLVDCDFIGHYRQSRPLRKVEWVYFRSPRMYDDDSATDLKTLMKMIHQMVPDEYNKRFLPEYVYNEIYM